MRPTDARRELRFTVVGLAQTKGSARPYTVRRTRIDGTPYIGARVDNDNPKSKGWQQTIANVAALELRRAQNQGLVFASGVEVEAWFHLPRPKSLLTKSRAGRTAHHTKKPDLDKLARALKDALTRVVWHDDSQVTDLHVRKRYCSAGEFPRVEIIVRDAVLEGCLL